MKKSTRRILALAVGWATALGFASDARATGLGVYGIAGLTGSSATPPGPILPPAYHGRWNLGFGGFVRGDMVPGFELEIGASFLKRTYRLNDVGNMDFQTLEIPVMVRVTGIPILTLGAGTYGAFKVGDRNVEPAAAGLAPTLKGFDFGLVGALGVEFPFGPAGVFAELRYLFGLSDLDDGAYSLQTRNFQGIAGVRIGI
jgi:hypothetical protein